MREEMQIELRQIQRAIGTTTILVTHDQSEAMALSDRIVVMNKGRVEQIATPRKPMNARPQLSLRAFLERPTSYPVTRAPITERRASQSAAEIWMHSRTVSGPVVASVRPEKVMFADPAGERLTGLVKTRIFQGNHWLYRVDTAAGVVFVIRQNSGETMPAEDEKVGLTWRAEDMTLRAPKAKAHERGRKQREQNRAGLADTGERTLALEPSRADTLCRRCHHPSGHDGPAVVPRLG